MRSLRLAQAAPPASDNRLPMARALFHLGRRPAALAVLGVAKSDAEHALRAVLDGNLLEASSRAQKISDPVLRLLAQVEIRDLRVDYQTEDTKAEVAALQARVPVGSDWLPFLQSRVKDEGSHWGGEDLSLGLARFDALIGAGDMVERGMNEAAASPKSADEVSLSLARSAFSTYDSQVRSAKAAPGADDQLRWLLLDLLQTQTVANLLAEGRVAITRATSQTRATLLARRKRCCADIPISKRWMPGWPGANTRASVVSCGPSGRASPLRAHVLPMSLPATPPTPSPAPSGARPGPPRSSASCVSSGTRVPGTGRSPRRGCRWRSPKIARPCSGTRTAPASTRSPSTPCCPGWRSTNCCRTARRHSKSPPRAASTHLPSSPFAAPAGCCARMTSRGPRRCFVGTWTPGCWASIPTSNTSIC